MSRYGRVQSPPPMQFHRLHVTASPATLKEVQHDVAISVLDQQDLESQGIDTSALVPGAQKTSELGSCTCNAGTACLATEWVRAGKSLADLNLFGTIITADDAVTNEEAAIKLYHAVTDQTGDPASEWPPTDSGSSGYYVCTELEALKTVSSYKSASGVLGMLSLLQTQTVMQGTPFFYAWEEPDASGFVDSDGSVDALNTALSSGVAGGHETLIRGIEKLTLTEAGDVDMANTVLRVRNSWGASWGDAGDFLIHASTLNYLAQYCDFKTVVI